MTLVVARIQGERIAIVSDTLLTEHKHPLPINRGAIKSCILPGGICVSFSNSPDLAARDLVRFVGLHPRGTGFSETVAFFERSSRETGNDYLIAFAKNPKLVTIADGERLKTAATTHWIGDHDAFRCFREYETKNRLGREHGRALYAVLFADEETGSPASNLYSVMRHVVADSKAPTVGGFVCTISNRSDSFRHSVYSDMLYNWPSGADESYAISFRDQMDYGASGENQEFAISQISTSYLGLNFVAFYVLKGRQLYLYGGEGYDVASRCTVLKNVEPSEIPSALKDAIGVDMQWLALVTSSPKEDSDTVRRVEPRGDPSNGVHIPFFCHVNTLPKRDTITKLPSLYTTYRPSTR